MIVSFIDGRIRMRGEYLKNPAVIDAIERIAKINGVRDVSANRRTGSVLILYDIAVIRLEQVLSLFPGFTYLSAALMPHQASRKIAGAIYESPLLSIDSLRIINTGMFAVLGLSMFGAIVGSMAVHVAAGLVFLGFLAMHIFRYRKNLFA